MFSRTAYVALKAETTVGTAVKPDVFFGAMKVDILTPYRAKPSMPIVGNRTAKINPIKDLIEGPKGKMVVEIEPKRFGHFLKGVFGGVTTGVYFPLIHRLSTGAITGTPQVGATLLQATSLSTAVVRSIFSTTALDLESVSATFNNTNLVTGTNPDGTTFTFTPSAAMTRGAFTVGETVTGGTSAKTAVVLAISNEYDYMLVGTLSGAFTNAEIITGGTSAQNATLGSQHSSVFGHEFKAPQTSLPSYTLEVGYDNEAHRFVGVRFNSMEPVSHKDNILTAELGILALYEFKHARITGTVASGAGAKSIPVDQTTGLITGDTIKVYRPGTGFLDFASSGVKTHTIGTLASETAIPVTNLQVGLQADDLIVLAPQTPSYSLGNELSWIGGGVAKIASTIATVLQAAVGNIEEFEFSVVNEMESRHAGNGINLVNRFPIKNHLKKLDGSGKVKLAYEDQSWLARVRRLVNTAFWFAFTGDPISTYGVNYLLDFRFPATILAPFEPAIEEDALLDQEIPFEVYRSATDGYTAKALLVTDTTTF